MLSGFTIGHSQHVAFVCGYALIPFAIACYYQFIREINNTKLVHLSIALFLMIYCSYPALTIISGYFMLSIFIWYVVVNRADKGYIKKLFLYHFVLMIIVVLFSTTLIIAYFQVSPFLVRFNGLPLELALKHPFSIKSIITFLTPMAAGNDPKYFATDISVSNGYWGIISLILFLFALTKKAVYKESYIILFFAVFSLMASFGDQFFLREFLYKFIPLMDRFQYPGLFRAFAIFGFLAFTGINLKIADLNSVDRRRLSLISAGVIALLVFLVWKASLNIDNFAYFKTGSGFTDELFSATRFDNIILQGLIQIVFSLVLVLIVMKLKTAKYFSAALLLMFVADGIVSTQLNTFYTVLSKTDPIKFSNYLKSSPKGFPIPELNPIEQNSDRNAANDFTWMNNNVFPKKVTFDGLVSFKMDGYRLLSDNHPGLLEAIKKEAVVYFSDDIREDNVVENFKSNTIFLKSSDYQKLKGSGFGSGKNDKLEINSFSPSKIEIRAGTEFPQLLTYQQNYYAGWKVYVDGIEKDLLRSNFTHMSVLVPQGEHNVVFEYKNTVVKCAFYFTSLLFLILFALSLWYFFVRHPERKKGVIISLLVLVSLIISMTCINRYFYQKNKLGLSTSIIENADQWKNKYKNDISILLSTKENDLKANVKADAICFINEKNNVSELSDFLVNSESKYFAFAWQGSIIGDDLFELMYSFYPEIIEQKKGKSSGYILLEKGTGNQTYDIIRTFEPSDSLVWMQNSARIKVDSASGNHTYFYTENEEFGAAIEFTAGKEFTEKDKITILSNFMIEEKLEQALLVFTTDREGKMQIYQTLDISRFAKYPDKWNRVVFVLNITPEIQEGDNIKIYFWNIKKIRFQIDNLKLKSTKQM